MVGWHDENITQCRALHDIGCKVQDQGGSDRLEIAQYLTCELESPDDVVDAFGLNVYSWCDPVARPTLDCQRSSRGNHRVNKPLWAPPSSGSGVEVAAFPEAYFSPNGAESFLFSPYMSITRECLGWKWFCFLCVWGTAKRGMLA